MGVIYTKDRINCSRPCVAFSATFNLFGSCMFFVYTLYVLSITFFIALQYFFLLIGELFRTSLHPTAGNRRYCSISITLASYVSIQHQKITSYFRLSSYNFEICFECVVSFITTWWLDITLLREVQLCFWSFTGRDDTKMDYHAILPILCVWFCSVYMDLFKDESL